MFRFHDPTYFYYLIILPIIGLLYVLFSLNSKRVFNKYFSDRLFFVLSSNVSKVKRNFKLALQLLALAAIIIALARPQFGQKSDKIKIEGIELIFAVDVSNSMMAEDVKPSRLELAKKSIERLLERMPGHKVGLIAFAGSAALASPLTSDYSALNMFIDSLSPDSVSTQGTNFRETLITSVNAFKRGGAEQDENHKITKAVVIFSDGEDNEKGALDKAKDLVSQGIRIFTVSVGTEKGAPIPMRDSFGKLTGYKKDKSNQTVMSQLHSEFLQKLAEEGKGGYYHATFTGEEISQIEEDINKLEKTEFESEMIRNYDEKYQIPLLLAFVVAFLEFLLTEKKKGLNLLQFYKIEMRNKQ